MCYIRTVQSACRAAAASVRTRALGCETVSRAPGVYFASHRAQMRADHPYSHRACCVLDQPAPSHPATQPPSEPAGERCGFKSSDAMQSTERYESGVSVFGGVEEMQRSAAQHSGWLTPTCRAPCAADPELAPSLPSPCPATGLGMGVLEVVVAVGAPCKNTAGGSITAAAALG
jgi:hypothetical protein